MSVKVMSWVWEHSRSRGAQRLVLLCIADHANDDGLEAFPSLARLARKTGMTERGVQKAIQSLVGLGELQVTMGGGRGRSNRYRVLMQTPNVVPPLEPNPEPETPNPIPRTTFTESGSTNTVPENPEPSSYELSFNRPKNSSSKSSSRKPEPYREDVEKICQHLADQIAANGSKRPKVTDEWRRQARLLIDETRDPPTSVDKIVNLIDWSQRNTFWRPNIQSMPKFREKYDRLRLEALEDHGGRTRVATHKPYRNPTDPDAYSKGL